MSFIPAVILLLLTFAQHVTSLQAIQQLLTNISFSRRQEQTTVLVPPDNIIVVGGTTGDDATITMDLVREYSISRNEWATPPSHPLAEFVDSNMYVFRGLI
jgi:hypothetical protein